MSKGSRNKLDSILMLPKYCVALSVVAVEALSTPVATKANCVNVPHDKTNKCTNVKSYIFYTQSIRTTTCDRLQGVT